MSKIDDIKAAVRQLSLAKLGEFREWLEEMQADLWDQQFEGDVKAGKLDRLADKWRADHRAGQSTALAPPRRSAKR